MAMVARGMAVRQQLYWDYITQLFRQYVIWLIEPLQMLTSFIVSAWTLWLGLVGTR